MLILSKKDGYYGKTNLVECSKGILYSKIKDIKVFLHKDWERTYSNLYDIEIIPKKETCDIEYVDDKIYISSKFLKGNICISNDPNIGYYNYILKFLYTFENYLNSCTYRDYLSYESAGIIDQFKALQEFKEESIKYKLKVNDFFKKLKNYNNSNGKLINKVVFHFKDDIEIIEMVNTLFSYNEDYDLYVDKIGSDKQELNKLIKKSLFNYLLIDKIEMKI